MDTKTKKRAKAHLETRRGELQEEVQRLDAEMRTLGVEQELERGGLGNHMAEDGSSVAEQDRILALGADLSELLRLVEEALDRIEDGSYGVCQRCEKPINPERLEAFPYVAYCIACQTIMEREHALHSRR
ncbi:MAG: TraR/DksA family transcriptional regulator [Chloroflexota bacterium]|nr:TraR/DksA family transcriptional regulator [Chloroflexota bacterium]